MVFASFLGVISNTDHRHFAFRTFPKLYPNFPELSRSSKPHFGSQSPGGKFHEALIHTLVANHQAESFTSSLSRFLPLYWWENELNTFQQSEVRDWRKFGNNFRGIVSSARIFIEITSDPRSLQHVMMSSCSLIKCTQSPCSEAYRSCNKHNAHIFRSR